MGRFIYRYNKVGRALICYREQATAYMNYILPVELFPRTYAVGK
jgi:hypothetical protein